MYLIFVVMCFLLTSCASIINGPDQQITILSNPAGAEIHIDGVEAGKTPATLRVLRAKDHTVCLYKEGYHMATAELTRSLSGVSVFYLLPGGLLSMAIDSQEGCLYSFPEKVDLVLKELFDPGTIMALHIDQLKSITQAQHREPRELPQGIQ